MCQYQRTGEDVYKHKSEDDCKKIPTYRPKPGELFELPKASAADKLITDTFVDDFPSGHNNQDKVKEMIDDADKIMDNGSFRFKEVTYTALEMM